MYRLSTGFTIIELLVVMAVLGIVSTVSFLQISSSTAKNQINSAVQSFADSLNLARISARESKPIGTTPAVWGISIPDASTYVLVAKTAINPTPIPITSYTLESAALSPAPATIWFEPLTGNLTDTSPAQMTISHLNQDQVKKCVTILPTGVIEIITCP